MSHCLGEVHSNEWFSVNLDPHASLHPLEVNATLTVTDNSNNLLTLSLSRNVEVELGSVMVLGGDRMGIVQLVPSSSVLYITSDAVLGLGEGRFQRRG